MEKHSIILFDGVCNLCNAAVKFVIKHDSDNYFLFASLQSPEGRELLGEYGLPADGLFSIILIENHKVYKRSTAALRISRKLNGFWPVLYGLIVVPEFIRDGVYNFIASHRYRWFGRKEECMIPTPELKAKFLHQ